MCSEQHDLLLQASNAPVQHCNAGLIMAISAMEWQKPAFDAFLLHMSSMSCISAQQDCSVPQISVFYTLCVQHLLPEKEIKYFT